MPNYEIISWDETTDISDHYSHDYLHLHQAYEILMLLSGEIDVLYYNQNQEITHQYHGVPGDLFFFASLEIHQIKITAFPYRRVGVRFSLHVFQNLFHNLALSTIYNYHGKQFCHQIRTSTSSELESLKNFLLSIHNEYLHQRPFYHDNMEYLIGQFTIALYRLKPEAFPVIEKEQLHILEEIKQYLQQNFTQSIQINVLARRFYLSHSYLCRAFKDYTGMTPKQYLCLCRLTYVRELLITTSLVIGNRGIRKTVELGKLRDIVPHLFIVGIKKVLLRIIISVLKFVRRSCSTVAYKAHLLPYVATFPLFQA